MRFVYISEDSSVEKYIERLEDALENGELTFDGIDYMDEGEFKGYLNKTFDLSSSDHLIPSHNVPHVLAKIIIDMLGARGVKCERLDYPSRIGTPYELDLDCGIKAISYTTDRCVEDCVEPDTCPVKGEALSWDIGKRLNEYGRVNSFDYVGFYCSHFAKKVATIPMQDILIGWKRVRDLLIDKKHFTLLIVTHSKCHGISALVKIG